MRPFSPVPWHDTTIHHYDFESWPESAMTGDQAQRIRSRWAGEEVLGRAYILYRTCMLILTLQFRSPRQRHQAHFGNVKMCPRLTFTESGTYHPPLAWRGTLHICRRHGRQNAASFADMQEQHHLYPLLRFPTWCRPVTQGTLIRA